MTSITLEERTFLYSPVAYSIRDTFTGGPPTGPVRLKLERQKNDDEWLSFEASPQVSSQHIWSYPGLGRKLPAGAPPLKCRVTVEGKFYCPIPPVEFDLHPHDGRSPLDPTRYARQARSVLLVPNADYPFPIHVPIVPGRIVDGHGAPMPGIEVSYRAFDKTTTDRQGRFALPIRWPPPGVWPLREIALRATAAEEDETLKLNSVEGIVVDDEFRLEIEVADEPLARTTTDAPKGSLEVELTDASRFVAGDRVAFDAPGLRLQPCTIAEIDGASIRLRHPLPQRVPEDSGAFLRYFVRSVDAVARSIEIYPSPERAWPAGTRLIRFPLKAMPIVGDDPSLLRFQVDVSIPSSSGEPPRAESYDIPVPDGFRFLEIRLS